MSDFEPPLSPLFVPADRPDRFAKAAASGADAIIVDLEDAVPPSRKNLGRHNLEMARHLAKPVFIRINPAGTEWHHADLEALRVLGFDRIFVPKVEEAQSLDLIETGLGRHVTIVAMIETARGLMNAREIAKHQSVCQLAFGSADYALDLGISPNPDAMSFALSQLVIASRAEALPGPLDGPTFDLSDAEAGLAADVMRAVRLGAGGKQCIHPKQVETVRRLFVPSQEEIDRARNVMRAAGDADTLRVGDQFADRPIVEQARRLLAKAAAAETRRWPKSNRPAVK